MLIAEGGVAGKLGLRRRHQLIAVAHIVHVAEGKAAALLEEWADYLAVNSAAQVALSLPAQHLGLQRIVSAQGGVPAADEDIVPARLERGSGGRGGYLPVRAFGLFRRKAAGIGEDEE